MFHARRRRPLWRALVVVAVMALVSGGVPASAGQPVITATSVTLDGASGGRTFDGVGAVSGGGGNSRLLIDYPEPQRGQILDYLFKPSYGAALQILKVEIGGDTNSTSGAEPSHSHFRGDLDCDRGYEWWIAEQAKARNPGIKLVGLPWGAPGWIGGGNFLSQDMIDYLLTWLGCARQHNLTIDYLTAAQNEKAWSAQWVVDVRNALTANGYGSIKVIAGDSWPGDWGPAGPISSNTAYRNAVDVLSAHYTCGYLSAQTSCTVPATVSSSGKVLWSSENGSQDYNDGAKPLARGINRVYLDGKMTAYLNFGLVGILAVFFVVGLGLRTVVNRCDRSDFSTYLTVVVIYAVLSALRGDSTQLLKTVAYGVLFFALVHLVSTRAGSQVPLHLPHRGRPRTPPPPERPQRTSEPARGSSPIPPPPP